VPLWRRFFLLLRCEVTFARPDLQVFLQRGDFDGAVAAVGVEIGRLVGDDVLAAKFVFDGGEGVGDVLHLERKESAAAGGCGELFENFIAAQDEAAIVGRNGVDDDLGALRHFDGLGAGEFALIVFAVADHDDGLARGMVGTVFEELIFAGAVNGVVERGAPAILQFVDAGGKQLDVVGEILRHLALGVEADDEGFVEVGADRVLQKADGGVLLEIETAVNRAADVDEQAEMQREIGFAAEIENRLRGLMVVENGEIGLVEVANKFAVLVGSDEQDVNFVDAIANGKHRAGLIVVRSGRAGIGVESGRARGVSSGLGEGRRRQE